MRKLGLVIATTIFTFAITMTTMAEEILIAGEERTGQRYETEIANSYGEGEEVEVHLIPKSEHLILKDVEEDSYIVVTAFSEDLQEIITAEDLYFNYSQSLELFYPFRWIENVDWFIDQILDDHNGIEDPMCEPVFSLSINGENEDIYIKFVDVPLLKSDNEKLAPDWKLVIEGEEKTGKKYPTVTKYFPDYDYGSKKVVLGQRDVHQIPREERIRFDNIDDDVEFLLMETFAFSDSKPNIADVDFDGDGPGFMLGQTDMVHLKHFDNDSLSSYQTITDETGMEDIIWCVYPTKRGKSWDFEIVVETNDENGNIVWSSGERAGDTDAYFFQFADIPLLDDDKKSENPIATDSNAIATDSNASRPSSGGSGGGSRKVATDSRNTNGIWVQDSIGWWFKKLDGSYPRNEWVMIKNKWYHFDEVGYMQTGWLDLNGVKYYLNPDGAMISGDWSLQDTKWYYFDMSGAMQANKWVIWKGLWYYLKSDGSMAVNATTPDGYTVNFDGVWIN